MHDVFYDTADELGVLIYHDAMYSGAKLNNPYVPHPSVQEETELRHQVRRLACHPSLVIWDSCNECSGGGVYDSFVASTIVQEDASRAIWPSCPSNGWVSGVDRLTGLPNGRLLLTRTNVTHVIETHGFYQHGTGFPGFPTVNNQRPEPSVVVDLPVSLALGQERGFAHRGVFASEFGAAVMSSFESMSATLAPEHWGIHGGGPADECAPKEWCNGSNPMSQRNYGCDNLIAAFFGSNAASVLALNSTGEVAFQRQLYLCMMAQALWMKSEIEKRRSDNQHGLLTWQLNEIWPTGGWGSVEYGYNAQQGQVVGGRWKPLHYMYTAHLFRDQIAVCGRDGRCVVRNDDPIRSFIGVLELSLAHLPAGDVVILNRTDVSVVRGAASFWWRCLGEGSIDDGTCAPMSVVLASAGCAPSGADCLLLYRLTNALSHTVDEHVAWLAPPYLYTEGSMQHGIVAPLSMLSPFRIAALPECILNVSIGVPQADGRVPVTVRSSAAGTASVFMRMRIPLCIDSALRCCLAACPAAMLVQLTTLAAGRFSENGFYLWAGAESKTVLFIPFAALDLELLRRSTRAEHLRQYLLP
jgi:hypothetical protein